MPLKFSIVTPSYNQAQFLEQTILSVLGQGSGTLEYIIMDGGSNDGSVEIIKRHEPSLAYWQSRKDGGQAAAINAGFTRSSGDILGWINSDDYYLPAAFELVGRKLDASKPQMLIANCRTVHEGSTRTTTSDVPAKHAKESIEFYDYMIQPSTFWTRKAWELVGSLNEEFRYTFDWEWFIRASRAGVEILSTTEVISVYRIHSGHKSSSGDLRREEELAAIYQKFHGDEVAGQFRECQKRKAKIQRLQKRLKGWHLSTWELRLLRKAFPHCFQGRNDQQIRGFLAMI